MLTPPAFVAMKLIAWDDRQAPRDLFALRELALRGHFTPEVAPLFHRLTGYRPGPATLADRVPRGVQLAWEAELGHRTAGLPDSSKCLETVRRALEALAPD